MSFIQKFVKALVPKRWFVAMEAESRLWMVRCNCGFARSIWDLGGMRGKAAGKTHARLKCPKCGEKSWHTVSRESPATPASTE